MRKRGVRHAVLAHRPDVVVVPGIPRRHGALPIRAHGFAVQDGSLFPERPFRLDREDGCLRTFEQPWIGTRCIWTDRSRLRGRPGGEAAAFDAYLPQYRLVGEHAGISEHDRVGVVVVNADVNLLPKFIGKVELQSGRELGFEEVRASHIGLFVEDVLLGVASRLSRFVTAITKKPPVENEVDVLGKALYQVERL